MTVHVHTKFEVKPDKIKEAHRLIDEYAKHVAEYARERDEEWTWVTFSETENPAKFVSISTHADKDAEQRHRETEGTKSFADKLYPNVVGNAEIHYESVASSLEQ